MKKNLFVIISLILVGAVSRLIPHWPNFTPVVASALFAGVYLRDKKLAVLVPLITMFITDIFLGFHQSMVFVYIPMILITLAGSRIRKPSFGNILMASVLGSIVFFLISNFGSFIADPLNIFPDNLAGLIACYKLALPMAANQWLPGPLSFTTNPLFADLIYNGILFGGYSLAQQYIPSLKPAAVKA